MKKNLIHYLLLIIIFWNTPVSLIAQDVNLYAFGHSLIDHRPPAIPTPSDETTVMHWLHDIAEESGKTFKAGGQYGFLTNHDDLPPFAQWFYDEVPIAWDEDNESFSQADINTVFITAANFVQYETSPSDPHPLDNSTTVVQATEEVFDWVNQQEPDVTYYIYGNWPEMDLQSAFPPTPPTQSEIDDFHNLTIGTFSDWWIDYQDGMLASRPGLNTRLIPVGSIISKIQRDVIPGLVPFEAYYEDSSPHGRATLYFLAGMISYMAVYEEEVASSYMPSSIVNQVVRDSLAKIKDFIWSELKNFNLPNGESRVFTTSGNVYYVSNSGDNNNSGLSLSDPFLSLQHASDIVVAGDSVKVMNGVYSGFDHRSSSGTDVDRIVFYAMGSNVLINQSGPLRDDAINIEGADYIVIDGFICNDMPGNGNGVRVVVSDNCIVKNCRCDHNAERGIFTAFTDDILIEHNVCTNSVDEHGIYVSNSSDRPIIRYNECYGNNNIGIHMNGDLSAGGDGIISNAKVYGNYLHDNNLAAGLNMDGVVNAEVYNNIITNNHSAQGIALFQGDGAVPSSGIKIYNNTILVPDDGRWGILVASGSNLGTEIYNNIIINQHVWKGCIAVSEMIEFLSDYNVLNDKMSNTGDGSSISLSTWQGLGQDLNSVLADPVSDIFVDDSSDDYHLKMGSQAIDIGTSLVDVTVIDDFDNNPRPDGSSFDIGAYEYQTVLTIVDQAGFTGVLEAGHVILNWTTKETDIDHFEIFKSEDGISWNKLAKVNSWKAYSNRFYKYDDTSLMLKSVYYKLNAIDVNSETIHLGNIYVKLNKLDLLRIYPNPCMDNITVTGFENSSLNQLYYIYNSDFKKVRSGILVDNTIDVSHLHRGMFYIQVPIGNRIMVKKIFKQ